MVNNQAEYQQYLQAINTLAGMQREAERSHQELSAQQTVQQERIEADRQKQLQQLNKICEAAIAQFRDLSLLFREVCNIPASVASPEPCSVSLKEAVRMQVSAAAELKQILDSLLAQREADKQRAIALERDRIEREKLAIEQKKYAEQQRIDAERRRRQKALDKELQRAGWSPRDSDEHRLNNDS